MKKLYFLLLILIMGVGFANAHDKDSDQKKEKMFREVQEFKMKYLAQEMDLSELQKKKFFEVYEEMEKSRQACFTDAMRLNRKVKKNKEATDADYQQATEAFNKANAEWAVEEKQYNEKLSEFLSQKQIFKMREAENNFRSKLDEMRQKKKKDHHDKHEKRK